MAFICMCDTVTSLSLNLTVPVWMVDERQVLCQLSCGCVQDNFFGGGVVMGKSLPALSKYFTTYPPVDLSQHKLPGKLLSQTTSYHRHP